MKLEVMTDPQLVQFFVAWDKHNHWVSRSIEEFLEASTAVMQYGRDDKVTYNELIEEMADVVISAVHVAFTTHDEYPIAYGIDRLNEAIVKKLQKGLTQI